MGRTYRRLAALFLLSIAVACGLFLVGTLTFGAEAADLSAPMTAEGQAIDTAPPVFKLLSPSEDEYQMDTYQLVDIQISEGRSGVDASSIEYRLTTQGLSRWSQWLPYKDADDNQIVHVILRENFRMGSDNYVQVRAKDLAGNPSAISRPFNIKVNSFPIIIIDSPVMGEPLTEGVPVVFDASGTYDPEGDHVQINWFRSTPEGLSAMGEGKVICMPMPQGEHTITVVASDNLYNEIRATFTISVRRAEVEVSQDSDIDQDGIPDLWEVRFQTDPNTPDSQMDSDGDGYTNLEEYQGRTNPLNKMSRPVSPAGSRTDNSLPLFSLKAWPLWAIFTLAVISVLMTMVIIRTRTDRQVRRIAIVHRIRRSTPSVPMEHVAITVAIAPLTGTTALRVLHGRARQEALPPPKPVEQMLPPAEIKKREAPQATEEEAAPEPEEDVHLSQAGTIPPPAKGAVDNNGVHEVRFEFIPKMTGNGRSRKCARCEDPFGTGPGPIPSGGPSITCSHNDRSSSFQFRDPIRSDLVCYLGCNLGEENEK